MHTSQESGPHARHYLCPLALISSPYECQATKVQLKYPQTKLIALSVLYSSVFSTTNSLYDFKRKIKISTTGNNSFQIFLFFNTFNLFTLCGRGSLHAMVLMWRSKDNVGPKDWTEAIRLGGKHLHLPSHLIDQGINILHSGENIFSYTISKINKLSYVFI